MKKVNPKDARKSTDAHGTTRKKSPTPKRGNYHTDMNSVQNPKQK